MRFILTLSCLFIVCTSSVGHAASAFDPYAQLSLREYTTWKNSLRRAAEQYNARVGKIFTSAGDLVTEASFLRTYYAHTRYYAPFSKSVLDDMTEYASIIDSASDRKAVNAALVSYHALLRQHLTNFDVLSFAITMARIDVRFGDVSVYNKLKKTLISIFAKKGKGLTPDTAFHIISYGEETYILEQFGGEVKKSEIYKVNRKYYNVHDIVTKDGEQMQIFMDVTTPIKRVMFKHKFNNQVRDTTIPHAR